MTVPGEQGRLDFEQRDPFERTIEEAPKSSPGARPRVVRVQPDVAAIDREFDYLLPEAWTEDGRADLLCVGSRVRIQLGGRRVGGWVTADYVEPPAGVVLRPLAKFSGFGPRSEIIDLARWAARRWAGRLAGFLTTASPPKMVASPAVSYTHLTLPTKA